MACEELTEEPGVTFGVVETVIVAEFCISLMKLVFLNFEIEPKAALPFDESINRVVLEPELFSGLDRVKPPCWERALSQEGA